MYREVKREGYWYKFEFKLAKNRIDYCLATTNPDMYCNGWYLYSGKDPGTGKEYVIVDTNNPELKLLLPSFTPPETQPVSVSEERLLTDFMNWSLEQDVDIWVRSQHVVIREFLKGYTSTTQPTKVDEDEIEEMATQFASGTQFLSDFPHHVPSEKHGYLAGWKSGQSHRQTK